MPGKPITAQCGTRSAYKRHLRHHETPCLECKKAHAKWHRENRKP